jgi:hypothetical protein
MDTLAIMNKSLCLNNNPTTADRTPINCLLQLNQQLLGGNGGTSPTSATTTTTVNNIELTFDRSLLSQQAALYKYEVASVAVALLTLCIKYGNVFWYTNKYLSFLVTFVCALASAQQLLQLYSFWFIAKQIYLLDLIRQTQSGSGFSGLFSDQRAAFSDTPPIAMHLNAMVSGQQQGSLLAFNYLLIDSYAKLLFFYALLSGLCLFTATPVYAFAYGKYRDRLRCEEAMFVKTIALGVPVASGKDKTKHGELNAAGSSVSSSSSDAVVPTASSGGCCFNYCPHLVATIQLIVICALKLPFCYDFIIYFNHLKDYGIMICIIVEILHTIILLFIWLLLTLKIGKTFFHAVYVMLCIIFLVSSLLRKETWLKFQTII